MKLESVEVVLHPVAFDTITSETYKKLPLESGGILLGYREGSCVVVTHVLPVASRTSTASQYVRDDVLANALLHDFLSSREATDPTGYVGEWHSHPAPAGPSAIDMKAIRATARATRGPIALLVYSPENKPQFNGVIAVSQRFGRVASEQAIVVVPRGGRARTGPLPEGAVRGSGPVFISYRQSDGTARADALEGLLRAAGLVVWRDRSDLRAGTTIDRLDEALISGLSAAVLIVTPEVAESVIVKERELPRLLQLDDDPRFSLAIANEIPHPNNADAPDFAAPDSLFGLSPATTLGDKKQSNSRTIGGRLEIVRDLLMHRIELIRAEISVTDATFTITTQTRPEPFALEAGRSHLHIRIKPPTEGKLPSRAGLQNLQATLPLTSDAVLASGASTVRISGGMHLSVAFAIGAALPETKIGRIEVVDLRESVWSSVVTDDPLLHTIATQSFDSEFVSRPGEPTKIAIFVTVTEYADETGFRRLIDRASEPFSSAARISLNPVNPIDEREAARLSGEIANEIKRLSAEFGRAEVHLAFHGPYAMAVHIGRRLNTLRTVIYEWDNPEGTGPFYTEVLTLELGVAGGPITRVHG